ncbi:glycosyltransferase family 4 protein [Kallotenue papyrolyticum]|uniref:glycosyltransferase family 4 protein n=1 Tax=Kallotenue papyrolyticum TaxID=1325125 RepID=UPI000478576F|nr:glycosyltransferase family 4 protein [Kallotenue papyrolyticum]
MKIVLPVHHFPPRHSAGAELYTFRLARWLMSHGHQAEVVCVEAIDRGAPGELLADHDSYAGVPVWRLSFNAAHADDPCGWRYHHPLIGAWFDAYLRRETPDLVHLQAGYLIGVAPLERAVAAGIPTILTLHDFWFLCPRITLQRGDGSLCTAIPDDPAGCAWCEALQQRRFRYLHQASGGQIELMARRLLDTAGRRYAQRRARLHAALALPDAVIAPSHFLARQFAPYVPPERLHVCRYGLDLTRFHHRPVRQPSNGMRIGYLGQIAPHKGVHVLIEAFRQLRNAEDATLHIYGNLAQDARYTQRLRRLAGNDSRIQLHGQVENARVATVLAELDATVAPSQWYENSPLAIMEAQAAGTPVVTAALGGMAELVTHEVDGLHFAPHSSADLARQLQRLIDEPDLLPRLRTGVRPPRGIDDEMAQVLCLYEQAIMTHAPIGALRE